MPKFRKKPVVIEAEQFNWLGDAGVIEQWNRTPSPCDKCGHLFNLHGRVETLEGYHIVCPGDWIITGIQGEWYPCKPDIFEATYERVEGK